MEATVIDEFIVPPQLPNSNVSVSVLETQVVSAESQMRLALANVPDTTVAPHVWNWQFERFARRENSRPRPGGMVGKLWR